MEHVLLVLKVILQCPNQRTPKTEFEAAKQTLDMYDLYARKSLRADHSDIGLFLKVAEDKSRGNQWST